MTDAVIAAPPTESVLYEVSGSTAIITLNRPETGNAQSYDLLYRLDDAFNAAVRDDAVRAIILRGAGKHFSSGHDIASRDLETWTRDDRALKSPWYDHTPLMGAERQFVSEQEMYLGMARRWREIPKPTIAAVQGACIAGGLILAWVCDFIVASEDAFFSDNTVSMGMPGVEYFAHAFELPPRIAREFLMLGERMTAEKAHGYGMVNRVAPRDQLMDECLAIADRLADSPRFALALTKQACNLVDDIQGKRNAMDGTFGYHHLSHSNNVAQTGRSILMPKPRPKT